jgi:serine/threonine protein kinase
MLCARPPFRGVTEYLTMQKVQEGIKVVVYPDPFPAVAKDLISALLTTEPEQRLGADNYSNLKSHLFFEGIDWVDLHKQTPPCVQSYGPMRWQEDIIREEQERLAREKEELRQKWLKLLVLDLIL